MREVDQENEPQKNKQHSTNEGEILTPDLKECLWNQECDDHKDQPDQDFGTPIAVL